MSPKALETQNQYKIKIGSIPSIIKENLLTEAWRVVDDLFLFFIPFRTAGVTIK